MARAWDALFDGLLAAQEELTRRISDTLEDQLPVYQKISRAALDVQVWREVEQVLRYARTGRTAPSYRELTDLAAIGEERAKQGVPVADMLRAWRIGVQIVVGYARELHTRLGIDDAELVEFIESALLWSDVAMVTTAGAHTKAELVLAEEERRATFVRQALLGTVERAQLCIQAEEYGLDPAGEYVAVRARLGEGVSAHKLERALSLDASGESQPGLTAVIDGDIGGFFSGPPSENVEGTVGFGPPRPLEDLAESYRLATRALITAHCCGITGAHQMSSFGLLPAVAQDNDVGEVLCQRYLKPLEAGAGTRELMETLRAYLASGMHVERTATQLFVHQNTVRYRLARFEELTGASLRDTKVVTELWWVLELSAMRG